MCGFNSHLSSVFWEISQYLYTGAIYVGLIMHKLGVDSWSICHREQHVITGVPYLALLDRGFGTLEYVLVQWTHRWCITKRTYIHVHTYKNKQIFKRSRDSNTKKQTNKGMDKLINQEQRLFLLLGREGSLSQYFLLVSLDAIIHVRRRWLCLVVEKFFW